MKEKILKTIHNQLLTITNNVYFENAPNNALFPLINYYDIFSGTSEIVDYDKMTIQINVQDKDRFNCLKLWKQAYNLLAKKQIINDDVYINYIRLEDAGNLDVTDPEVSGRFVRFKIYYKGDNLI